MRLAWPRLRLAGIPVRIHFTFLLLVVWFGYVSAQRGGSPWRGILFLLLLFASVVLHELGHALMARRFGVETREIVLYPIGGVARLERITYGKAELFIALAGPAVNLVLATLLTVVVWALEEPWPTPEELVAGEALLLQLLFANILLALFNLIPAFPMDGGRVLRSLLTFVVDDRQATTIAARTGQGIAVLFALVGLRYNPILLLIGVFVFFGAGQELAFFRTRHAMTGHTVADAMLRRFSGVRPQDALTRVAAVSVATSQRDFPVVDAWGRVAGVLTRGRLARGLAESGSSGSVLEFMQREVERVSPGAALEEVVPRLQARPGAVLVVMDEDRLVGLLTWEHLYRALDLLPAVAAATVHEDESQDRDQGWG